MMFFVPVVSDLLTYFLAVIVISSYVVFAVCFSVAFSSAQRLSFVQLNLSNLHGATFVLFCLVLLLPSINYEQFITLNVINHSFYSSFFQISLLVVIICFFILTNEYVKVKNLVKFEYCLVILFALLGLLLIISSETLLTFYLAIELQSLCFYILACSNRNSNHCAESALKYFVLGAFSSGLLLIAFALLYSSFGTICFESFERICSLSSSLNAFSGSFIFFVALLFKFGSFPFHLWLCDVYEGSMLNVTLLFSTVPKLVLLGLFIKLNFTVFSVKTSGTNLLLLVGGLGSICFASVAALYQKRIKRLIAYSTVSHTGFLVLSVYCLTVDSAKASIIYILLYIMMSLALFSILIISSSNGNNQKYIINWISLFDRNHAMAYAFAFVMFSIAGIPPLAGFYSKLCVLSCLLAQQNVLITIIIAVFSSIACFYYVKLIKVSFFSVNESNLFWFGHGTKHVELFLSLFVTVIMFFLLRSNAFLNLITLTSISLL